MAVRAGAFGEREAEPENQMFMVVKELFINLDLRKQRLPIEVARGVWFLVQAGLLQIRAVARAVERHLALFSAALRADLTVHRRAEPLLFPFIADCASHVCSYGF